MMRLCYCCAVTVHLAAFIIEFIICYTHTMTKDILIHFKNSDPKIYPYIERFQNDLILEPESSAGYFKRLARNIAFQQLHGKAATTIWERLIALLPEGRVTPENIMSLTNEEMRACGLSNAKVSYIKNIAEAFINDANYMQLDHLSDEEVIELLTKIKGVGKWTAEMFLMFTLGREDVFSYGDFALRKGITQIYGYKKEPSRKTMERIVKKWSPYKTYASLALWKTLDNE
jgi:DNA-3-methyladenine glycosylase II